MLEKYNFNINDADDDGNFCLLRKGRTCLHIASSLGYTEIVGYLIKEGANVNPRDRFGGTPRGDALRNGHDIIAKILLDHGATQPAKDEDLDLIPTRSKGTAVRAQRLLKKQVSPNCWDNDGKTPLLSVPSGKNEKASIKVLSDAFVLVLGLCQVIVIILYCVFGSYKFNHSVDSAVLELQSIDRNKYPYYQDVHVMIFIGFGFLMTFLRRFGYSSLGLTFLISVLAIQLHPLLFTLWSTIFDNEKFIIYLDISALVMSDFAAGAILISFGALLGKTSPLQMLIITVFESFFYSLNEKLALLYKVSDVGGSIVIHTFGAFFGLSCSKAIQNIKSHKHPDNAAVYHSDLFAMIGTLFLWMFWPSFNAALTATTDSFERAVINTILSLTASCASAFLFSYILRNERRFMMVDIQNATLAGGVALGASADLPIGPGIALLVGALTGIISVFGFSKLQSLLEQSLGIYDTCGIANLHGIPGVLGGLVQFSPYYQ